VLAQLGDGAILDLDTMAPAIPASPRTPEDNPYTIARENWREGLVLAEAAGRGWVLLTDGGLELFPDSRPGFDALLAEPGDPAQKSLALLRWVEGSAKADCHDDRTAAVLKRA
jgi:hypothetical protein